MTDRFQGPADGAWTMEQLLEAEMAEVRLKFLPFWGHTTPSSGEIGAHVFSQWYAHDFVCDAVSYATAEHFMMAEKARLFGDQYHLDLILRAATPGEAKEAWSPCSRIPRRFVERPPGRDRCPRVRREIRL